MNQYTVTWGDESQVVSANSEQDAWAEFAKGNDHASRHPKHQERKVELVPEVMVKAAPPAPPVAPIK